MNWTDRLRARLAASIAPQAMSDTPHPLVIAGAGTSASSGVSVTPDTAMQAAAVHACVRVVSEDVAKLPCVLYRRTKDGGKERATDHPLYRLVKAAPNKWQTPIQFFGNGQAKQELRGAAFALITRGVGGRPVELLPLKTEDVAVEQRDDWSLVYKIRGAEVPALNILHVPGLSLDGVRGVSTITYARETIGLALATERHGAQHFGNGAKPGLIIRRPSDAAVLSPEAGERLVASVNEKYGRAKAFSTMLLEEGTDVTSLSISNEDSQFLETRQYGRTEIAGIFRVPPHKIGDLSRATFSNIEHQALEYLTDALLPRLVRWEQALSRALLSDAEQDEYFFEFLVDAVLRGDFQTRMNGYTQAIQNGIMSANEVRAKENLNPREGGDMYLRPGNMMPWDAPAPQPTPSKDAA
jgi:HK97 family phage portal protein